jgi:hypothetical protein
MDYIQILSAAGIGGIIGSLLTTVVQAWLSNKQHVADRIFQEKKEARYIAHEKLKEVLQKDLGIEN